MKHALHLESKDLYEASTMSAKIRETAGDIEIGESKVTSKGQITVPGAVRKELGLAAGDKLTFVRAGDGSVRIRSRKRTSILDYARANPIVPAAPIGDLNVAIDDAVAAAMHEQERRASKNRRS
jgi:AbrB family looped-hinge helix DNA binding protein